ncbi:DMT family transporter [Dethiothermospora halolimnae]|uniref:DMT family transporter n=1 Tax=Dethiothermospora halolimnae TaxID=3114390 RepID=UPI003CCB87EF
MYIFLAFLIGISIVISTILNGKIGEQVGVLNGVMINYGVGFIASIIICVIVRNNTPAIEKVIGAPFYYFLGGFLGVAVVFLFNVTVPKVPAVYIVILPFIGQMFTSAIIDYFYLDTFSKGKVVGGILLMVGLIYNTKVDKEYREEGA